MFLFYLFFSTKGVRSVQDEKGLWRCEIFQMLKAKNSHVHCAGEEEKCDTMMVGKKCRQVENKQK